MIITQKHKHKNKQKHLTTRKKKILILPNNTPREINHFSQLISHKVLQNKPININPNAFLEEVSSYAPTVNKDLVSLKSIERQDLTDCNNSLAFTLKEPLKISIKRKLFGYTCVPYYDPSAIKFLFKVCQIVGLILCLLFSL